MLFIEKQSWLRVRGYPSSGQRSDTLVEDVWRKNRGESSSQRQWAVCPETWVEENGQSSQDPCQVQQVQSNNELGNHKL